MRFSSFVPLVFALGLVCAPALSAQPLRAGDPLAERVAAALYERSALLFERGDFANAEKLARESLEKSSSGPSAAAARELLARVASRRADSESGAGTSEGGGISDLDAANVRDGPPVSPLDPYPEPPEDGVLDPYPEPSEDGVLDPYPDSPLGAGSEVVDPYPEASPAPPSAARPVPTPDADAEGRMRARHGLIAWAGLYGFELGLALSGPEDDAGDFRGIAAVTAVLGAAATGVATYVLTGERPLDEGQSAAIASAGTWGAVTMGLFGDIVSGDASEPNTIHRFVAVGGALGAGLGTWYALDRDPPSGEVAVFNSLASYGLIGGLLLGVAMDPPRSEAYALNAFLGSSAGMVASFAFGDRLEMSRRRSLMVDLGAAAGFAAPWVLLLPITDSPRAVSLVSVLGLVGGAGLAFYLTEGDGASGETAAREARQPALFSRSSDGRWRLGVPLPALGRADTSLGVATGRSGFSLTADLAAGNF